MPDARELTYLDAIREGLAEEMRRDPKVFVLGEDVGAYGGAFGATQGLFEEFGESRVVDTPISESAIVGISIGASLRGYRPVAEMQFADFISCAFDQIVNQAATLCYRYGGRSSVPIVVRAPSGGNVGGGLYHSQNPEAWFVHRPGLKVVAPATPFDAKGLLKAAIRDDNPVVYVEHKYLYRRAKGPVPEGDEIVPIGVAATRREGDDITLITYGAMLAPSLEAADELAKEGVEVEVIDLRTLQPYDKRAIFASLEKTSRVVIVHEDVKTLGIGAELSAVIMEERFERLDAPVLRVTYPDTHAPFSHVLEAANLPNRDKIVAALRRTAEYRVKAAMQSSPEDTRADVELIDRVVARDAAAIADLYDRHSRLLYGLILRIVRDRSEAEELLQEVFVQVWTRADTYDVKLGTPIAWLVRIARNRAIDRLRANTVRTRTVEAAPLPPPVETPEARASMTEQERAVARALQSLPPDQRQLIEHAYFVGMTQSELAERFGLPLGTVKTRVRTGMMTLRRDLQRMMVGVQKYEQA